MVVRGRVLHTMRILYPYTGICRTTWCGVLWWAWWRAWVALTRTPGKNSARYAIQTLTWTCRVCRSTQDPLNTAFFRLILLFECPKKKKKSAKHRRCNNDTEPSEVITIVVTSLSFVYAVDVALETTHRKVITHKLHYPVGECTPSLIWTARRTKLNSLVWVISSLCCAGLWI